MEWIRPEWKTVRAVDGVSFSVSKGEIVALIGPNGAGKSTTMKMMSGILVPSAGEVKVAGLKPVEERKELAFKIGTVWGQRSNLMYNLPIADSFELFGRIYELSEDVLKKRRGELFERFDLADLAGQPVRKLSLGQRMRAEVALALLHAPEIVFLDEPTIGLDVVAKKKLREMLKEMNKELETTIILTSHDTADIEALCERTIVVNHGKVVVDKPTTEVKGKFFEEKFINLHLKKPVERIEVKGVQVLEHEGVKARLKINVKENSLNDVMKELVNKYEVEDVDVHSVSLEEVVGKLFKLKSNE